MSKLVIKLRWVFVIFGICLLLGNMISAYVKQVENNKIDSGIVEQYCHVAHRYSVDKYLECKDNDIQNLVISLTDEIGIKLSKASKKELEEATK